MFRKDLSVKSRHVVKSSDRRNLRQRLHEACPNISANAFDEVIPLKDDAFEILKSRTTGGLEVDVYVLNSVPIAFECEVQLAGIGSRKYTFPSLHTLSLFPSMMPNFTIHPPVLTFLTDGADLMWPGIKMSDEELRSSVDFIKGDVRSIFIDGSPANPVAVGLVATSKLDLKERKGRALQIFHVINDSLWNMGMGENIHSVNTDAMLPIVDDMKQLEEKISEMEVTERSEDFIKELTESEVDAILESALLQCLKFAIGDDQFPLLASTLYSNYILPNRPSGTWIDIKQSSYKKLAKFLKVYEKKGLIKTKEMNGNLSLVGYNKSHPLISNTVHMQTASSTKVSIIPDSGRSLKIKMLFKPTALLSVFFKTTDSNLYTIELIEEIIDRFVAVNQLMNLQGIIELNMDLKSLQANSKRDITTPINRQNLVNFVVSLMSSYYEISDDCGKSVIRKGCVIPIHIFLEVKNGRRITRVQGLETFLISPESFANEMQVICASSTAVTALSGKASNIKEVLIQGYALDEISDYLTNKMGIDKQYIETLDKVKPKKK